MLPTPPKPLSSGPASYLPKTCRLKALRSSALNVMLCLSVIPTRFKIEKSSLMFLGLRLPRETGGRPPKTYPRGATAPDAPDALGSKKAAQLKKVGPPAGVKSPVVEFSTQPVLNLLVDAAAKSKEE